MITAEAGAGVIGASTGTATATVTAEVKAGRGGEMVLHNTSSCSGFAMVTAKAVVVVARSEAGERLVVAARASA